MQLEPSATLTKSWLPVAGVAAAAVAAAAYNRRKTRQAEHRTPPVGAFIEVGGVKLHYLRRGKGPCIVLLHGNGVLLQDWLAPGMFDELARSHEVIAFDRPGFGYSTRPRFKAWTPARQAALIAKALRRLGIRQACIVGHSFGTMVATALALDHPTLVSRLVLLGGFYFPTFRPDLVLHSGQALPVAGDMMTQTITPIATRAMMPAIEKGMFSPAPVDRRWRDAFPTDMIARPSQMRATSADFSVALPAAAGLAKRYGELRIPITIIAGRGDKVVGHKGHSERLHQVLPGSRLVLLDGVGHMVHYTAYETVLREIVGAGGEDAVLGQGEPYLTLTPA